MTENGWVERLRLHSQTSEESLLKWIDFEVLPDCWLVDQVFTPAVVLHVGVIGVKHCIIGENFLLNGPSICDLWSTKRERAFNGWFLRWWMRLGPPLCPRRSSHAQTVVLLPGLERGLPPAISSLIHSQPRWSPSLIMSKAKDWKPADTIASTSLSGSCRDVFMHMVKS